MSGMQLKTTTTAKRKVAPTKPKGVTGTRTPSPLSKGERKALSKVEHCRSELAAVYRQARSGALDVGDASKLANILSILSRMIENSDLERRLEMLEQQLQGGKP